MRKKHPSPESGLGCSMQHRCFRSVVQRYEIFPKPPKFSGDYFSDLTAGQARCEVECTTFLPPCAPVKKRGASLSTYPSIVRGETSIYLIAPRLYGIFNVAITAITFLISRPKGQPFKNFREQRFSVVVPCLRCKDKHNFRNRQIY